jgi:hypothetical protein
MDSQKHTAPGVRAEALTIPELEQSKAGGRAQYACLGSFSSELRIRHQQVHRVVLQRTQIDLQSRRGCPLQVTPGKSPPVRLYNQFASFSDPKIG